MTTFPAGHAERIAEDVVAIYSNFGVDFVRICVPHQWASADSVRRVDLPTCPHCELTTDTDGRARFDNINRRLMPAEAQK